MTTMSTVYLVTIKCVYILQTFYVPFKFGFLAIVFRTSVSLIKRLGTRICKGLDDRNLCPYTVYQNENRQATEKLTEQSPDNHNENHILINSFNSVHLLNLKLNIESKDGTIVQINGN